MTKKQFVKIAETLSKDPKLYKIWVNKLTYIIGNYVSRFNESTQLFEPKVISDLCKRMCDITIDPKQPDAIMLAGVCSIALLDSFKAMAPDILSEGEMRLDNDVKER